MTVQTAWVRPAKAIAGQDPLGTQAPCEAIYGALLPGITNVTARARYYSFYPWFLRHWGRLRPGGNKDDLVMCLRRAECLFALIAIRHARLLKENEIDHGATMVGRDELVPAIDEAEDEFVQLSRYADLGGEKQYFQNVLGGLGQYYFGALREIGVLGGDTARRDLRFTTERGLPLAQLFSDDATGERFFAALVGDVVAFAELDALSSLCPCGLRTNDSERAKLIELLVDPARTFGDESVTRRATCGLVLDLAAGSEPTSDHFVDDFRGSVYGAARRGGERWQVPDHSSGVLAAWRTYAANDLLSYTYQALFWAALTTCLNTARVRFQQVEDVADFVCARWGETTDSARPFRALLADTRATMPEVSAWENEAHEMSLGLRIPLAVRAKDPALVAERAFGVICALACRLADEIDPYAVCAFDATYLDRYPLNLRSFGQTVRRWSDALTVREALRSCVTLTIRAHFRVAMQKIADASPRDTFKIRPLERGVVVIDALPPSFTSPRIERTRGLLRDLGLLSYPPKGPTVITDAGRGVLEQLRG